MRGGIQYDSMTSNSLIVFNEWITCTIIVLCLCVYVCMDKVINANYVKSWSFKMINESKI